MRNKTRKQKKERTKDGKKDSERSALRFELRLVSLSTTHSAHNGVLCAYRGCLFENVCRKRGEKIQGFRNTLLPSCVAVEDRQGIESISTWRTFSPVHISVACLHQGTKQRFFSVRFLSFLSISHTHTLAHTLAHTHTHTHTKQHKHSLGTVLSLCRRSLSSHSLIFFINLIRPSSFPPLPFNPRPYSTHSFIHSFICTFIP